jgi:hypothetical protein
MNEFLHKKKEALLFSLVVCFALSWGTAQAQTRSITGTVKDASTHESIPGVSVVVKGTNTGTITDATGVFAIQVASENDILVFSFVGYSKTEVSVSGKTIVDVDLATDLTTLEEIVVVGYGEQKKSVVTGAISSVKASELATMP